MFTDKAEFAGLSTEILQYLNCYMDDTEAQHEDALVPIKKLQQGLYDAIHIVEVYKLFISLNAQEFHVLGKVEHVSYNLKYVLGQKESSIRA